MGVWGFTDELERAEAVVAAGVGPVEEIAEALASPEALGVDRLEHQIVSQAAHLSAAMCRWLLLVAEYDRREGYGRWECRSTAHWLEWKCGLASATAREHVRVARALVGLPRIREAFSRAEVSYSKVRALTRAATAETEAELLGLARDMTGSQLERVMRTFVSATRQITRADLHENYARRDFDRYLDSQGRPCWVLRPSPEEDAMLTKAVEYARDRDYTAARAENREIAASNGTKVCKVGEGRGSQLPGMDALMRVIEWGLTRAVEYDDDELPSERYQVVLHVHASPRAGEDGLVHLDNGTKLHPKTAQRLGCSATVTLVDGDGTDLNHGRRTRLFTRRQRRALARQANHCAFPHCDIPTRWCDAHHLISWNDGGPTDIDNGMLLCKRHHHAVHEGGWRLFVDPNGLIIAVGPDGQRVTRSPFTHPPRPGFLLLALHARLTVEVETNHNPPNEAADLRFITDVLISNYEHDYRKKKEALAAEEQAHTHQAEHALNNSPTDAEGGGGGGSGEVRGQQPLLN